MEFHRQERRSIALLEVLISFALIVLCVFPLIAPQVFILKSEREFIHLVELDHLVNLLFANRLEKLYQNRISWDEIKNGREVSIDQAMLEDIGFHAKLPFKGSYRFLETRRKGSTKGEAKEKEAYIFTLIFSFEKPSKKKDEGKPKILEYSYLLPVEHRIK